MLKADVTHLYHHINVAWNARDVADEQYACLTEEQFHEWGMFPGDLET